MPIVKESSDELNPPVVTTGISIAPPARGRSLTDYLALAIATCGVGYLPLAPGTWGSLVGVGIYLLWDLLWGKYVQAYGYGHGIHKGYLYLWTALSLGLAFCLTMVGVWAATRVEKLSGRKDPGVVVIDEVAGQFITFLAFSWFNPYADWPLVIAGFLMFRVFDIWKPYPIRRLEVLESGLGVMADDVLAGAYAAIALSFIASIYWLFF
jgi:phosphatidylglycerophosphatase A